MKSKTIEEYANKIENSLTNLISNYMSKNLSNNKEITSTRKSDSQTRKLFSYMFTGTRGGTNRLRIILLLAEKPLNAHQLSKELRLDYNAIEFHMAVLEKNNLVSKTGDHYGSVFFLSDFLEYNIDAFNEILSKIKKC